MKSTKKILVIALAALMLFAFTACNSGSSSFRTVRNSIELQDALDAGYTNISIEEDFTLREMVVISGNGTVISGNGHTITIATNLGAAGEYVINVTGSDVVMDGVNIDVTAEDAGIYVINASNSNSGFEFKNGSITGKDWDSTSSEKASIAIGLNVGTDATVSNSKFQDCFTPIYVNGDQVTLNGITFNSGINFNAVIAADKLVDLVKQATDNWPDAKLNFEDVPGIQVTAANDPLAAIRTKFPELTVVPALPEQAQ